MKQKRLKTQRYDSEDTKEIRNLIIIAVILIALAVGLYFLTDTILSKKNYGRNKTNSRLCNRTY